MTAHHVIVFARAPELGKVKTRLAADVGAPAALGIYRMLGRRAVAAACSAGEAEVTVQFTPAGSDAVMAAWLAGAASDHVAFRVQEEGDLGARMSGAIRDAVHRGATAVAVIGTDCPSMDADVIARAFAALETVDVVLGPALDGGYYLIAARTPHEALFSGIPWSSCDTLRCTMEAADAAGLRVALLEPRMDVDTGEDWRQWLELRPADAPAHTQLPVVRPL